jgi:hypothetical protein
MKLVIFLPAKVMDPASIPAIVFKASSFVNFIVSGGISPRFVSMINSENFFDMDISHLRMIYI